MKVLKTTGICFLCLALIACSGSAASSSPANSAAAASSEESASSVEEASSDSAASTEDGTFTFPDNTEAEEAGEHFEPSEFHSVVFHEESATGNDAVKLDASSVAEGYVAASAVSEKKLKFQVKYGDTTYNYDLDSDGTPCFYPLQSGDGSYTFRVMQNIVDNKYSELYAETVDVTLADEFQPYIRPNVYVNYNQDSECVKLAAEYAAESTDELDFISKVFDRITETVTYDYDKAEAVQSYFYVPDPDEILASGKGICFDYAALTASMLRSQGIPTKVIFGYVHPEGIYHAWNMFYTAETGWISVEFEAPTNTWGRLDLTFSAAGSSEDFIQDNAHYTDVYYY